MESIVYFDHFENQFGEEEPMLQTSVAKRDVIWGITTENQILKYEYGNQWTVIDPLPENARCAMVACGPDGTVMAIDDNNVLFRYVPGATFPKKNGDNPWKSINISGNVETVSIGGANLIGLCVDDGKHGQQAAVYLGEGETYTMLSTIPCIGGTDGLSVGADGTLFFIGYERNTLWKAIGGIAGWPLKSKVIQTKFPAGQHLLTVAAGGVNAIYLVTKKELIQYQTDGLYHTVKPMLRQWNTKAKKWTTSDISAPYSQMDAGSDGTIVLRRTLEKNDFVNYRSCLIQDPERWTPPLSHLHELAENHSPEATETP